MTDALPADHLPGANFPPSPIDPLAALTVHADDLWIEASNYADGAPIETAGQAADVDRLIDDVKAAIKACEDAQDAETAPLNNQVKAIRERFYVLIGDTKKITGKLIKMRNALLVVKTAWGDKERKRLAAIAEQKRQDALRQAQEAAQAAQEAKGDLEASDSAEALIQAAQAALRDANRADKAIPGKGYRTVRKTELVDGAAAARWAWANRREECEQFFTQLARQAVTQGHRVVPGFTITETKEAV